MTNSKSPSTPSTAEATMRKPSVGLLETPDTIRLQAALLTELAQFGALLAPYTTGTNPGVSEVTLTRISELPGKEAK
ncbi:MAG: hypothetical protein SFW67_31120 [Myxococcaceae bacterium]|nr:hypothetical protein [Myxococcaceae bacterium]